MTDVSKTGTKSTDVARFTRDAKDVVNFLPIKISLLTHYLPTEEKAVQYYSTVPEEPFSGGQDGLYCVVVLITLGIPYVFLDSVDEIVEGLRHGSRRGSEVTQGVVIPTCSLADEGREG